ncbi:MAG: hypothetical protein ACK41D_12090 [Rubricoccaceae bacterium]
MRFSLRSLLCAALLAGAPAVAAQVAANEPARAERQGVRLVGEDAQWAVRSAPGAPYVVRAVTPGARAARIRAAAALAEDDPARAATPAEADRLVRRLAAAVGAAPDAERATRVAALEAALARRDDLCLAQQQAYLDGLRARLGAETVRLEALEAALADRRASRASRLEAERRRLVGR